MTAIRVQQQNATGAWPIITAMQQMVTVLLVTEIWPMSQVQLLQDVFHGPLNQPVQNAIHQVCPELIQERLYTGIRRAMAICTALPVMEALMLCIPRAKLLTIISQISIREPRSKQSAVVEYAIAAQGVILK
jgi:hypothetical protein